MTPKRRAAEAALKFVQSGMVVGLGTGSTADEFLQALAAALAGGRLRDIRGIPTSRQSEARARQLGIPIVTLAQCQQAQITIDGADEVAPDLDLIKGLGGALLREKLVAQAARRFVVIVDQEKRVSRLGEKCPIPVEVVPFGWTHTRARLARLGLEPTLRQRDGKPVVTDGGNWLLDCRLLLSIDPRHLAAQIDAVVGVVEHGLFLGMAERVLLGGGSGVEEILPARRPS